jgi:uncharacterized SAM-binding protein YcdF (DUF218 family)
MFFLLSKVLDFLLLPTVWLLILLVMALLAPPPRRRRWLVAALGLLAVSTNPFFVNELLLAWEPVPVALAALPRQADAAVLLTGITQGQKSPHDRVYLGPGADRFTSALWLCRAGRVRRIIVSGGSGAVQATAHTEADDLTTLLRLAGVPNAAIIREEKSRNTRENALFTKQLLAPEQDTLILVTSAFHQRRAMGCFAKVGLHPISFPAGYRSRDRRLVPEACLVPSPEALASFSLLVHEVAGWVVYKVLGYA